MPDLGNLSSTCLFFLFFYFFNLANCLMFLWKKEHLSQPEGLVTAKTMNVI